MQDDNIMNLMVKFGMENPKGFQWKDVFDYLVLNGIDMETAKQEINFQIDTMEILDNE